MAEVKEVKASLIVKDFSSEYNSSSSCDDEKITQNPFNLFQKNEKDEEIEERIDYSKFDIDNQNIDFDYDIIQKQNNNKIIKNEISKKAKTNSLDLRKKPSKEQTFVINNSAPLNKNPIKKSPTFNNLSSNTENLDDDFLSSQNQKEKDIIKKQKNDKNIEALTNTEDIVNFYEFLHTCLNRISKMTPASDKEISDNKINYKLNKNKCKFNLLILLSR